MFLDKLEEFYKTEGQEGLRLAEDGPQYLEFLTATSYLERWLKPRSKILDSCAGSGAYAFFLAEKGHNVTAGDLLYCNLALILKREIEASVLGGIFHGDCRKLSWMKDGSYDAVLCMGALYHLHEAADRMLAVQESARLIKPGGLLVCTYMNRYAVILNNSEGSLENIDEIMQFAEDGREGVFYASKPSEMEEMAEAAGFEKLCHVGLDGMSTFLRHTAGRINDEGAIRWRKYHFSVCEDPSLLGASYHNMYIGRKAK